MENTYFYTIVFKGGSTLAGHNCTSFEIERDYIMEKYYLILRGFDELNYTSGFETKHWGYRYELDEIVSFKVIKMRGDEECL